jgi:hypothetical protein
MGTQADVNQKVVSQSHSSPKVGRACAEALEERRLLSVVTLDGTNGIDQYYRGR